MDVSRSVRAMLPCSPTPTFPMLGFLGGIGGAPCACEFSANFHHTAVTFSVALCTAPALAQERVAEPRFATTSAHTFRKPKKHAAATRCAFCVFRTRLTLSR